MAEEANVVNESAVSETAATESTPVENNSTDVVDDEASFDAGFDGTASIPQPESKADDPILDEAEPAEEVKEEPTEEVTPEEEAPKEEPQTKADARKEQLNNEIRELVNQRNQIRQEVERINQDAYVPAKVDELLEQVNPDTGDYYNRLEAQYESLRQEREVEKYTNQVSESRLSLTSEAQAAVRDFPMFDESSPEYDPDVAAQADQILAQSLVYDQKTNQVIGSHISPYQLYKTVYDSAKASEKRGAVSGQKATEKMLSNADTTTGVTKHSTPKDAFLQGFESDF
jgi:hypothetical protein